MANYKKYDVVIISALHDTEYEALLDLTRDWKEKTFVNDNTTYHESQFGKGSVLIATDDQMGIAGATALTTKVIWKFQPKFIIMSGVAAGIKSTSRNYGDIMFCLSTWNYDSGKYQYKMDLGKTVFEPEPEQLTVEDNIITRLNRFRRENPTILTRIKKDYPEDLVKPKKQLRLHIGPIATGSAVVASEKKVNTIKGTRRKLLGIDMETYGVFYGAKKVPFQNKPFSISIKSISDFADGRKNDKYKNYAAYTSAKFIYWFIREGLID